MAGAILFAWARPKQTTGRSRLQAAHLPDGLSHIVGAVGAGADHQRVGAGVARGDSGRLVDAAIHLDAIVDGKRSQSWRWESFHGVR